MPSSPAADDAANLIRHTYIQALGLLSDPGLSVRTLVGSCPECDTNGRPSWTYSSSLRTVFAQVVGLVTRKDLSEPNAKLVLGRKANLGLASGSTDALVRSETLPFIPYGALDRADPAPDATVLPAEPLTGCWTAVNAVTYVRMYARIWLSALLVFHLLQPGQ